MNDRDSPDAQQTDGQSTDRPRYDDTSPFRRRAKDPLVVRALPVTAELRQYRPRRARQDVLAGVTVAALALPAAMAYSEVAGVSPINGLYALLLPAIAYLLVGSSRQLIVGPEGSVATLVGAAIISVSAPGSGDAATAAAMLALLVAALFVVARLLRFGWIADYFSRPVLVGYIHGVAVVLIIGQLGKMLGLSIAASEPLPQLWEVVKELGDSNVLTVLLSVSALVVLLGLRYLIPRLPAALLIVIGAIALSWATDLQAHDVAVVGAIPSGLPSFDFPNVSLGDVARLMPGALAIFVVSFADEILTARSFAGKHNQNVRASQELLAMGAANAAAGFTQGFPIGASGSRTAVNDGMGARSQVAGAVAAVTVGIVLVFLTEPVQYLPKCVLGAVIVSAAIGLLEPVAWRSLAVVDRVEVAIAGVTTACVIVFGVLEALVVAVGLSLIDTVRRSASPNDAVLGWVDRLGRYADVSFHPSARITPGVVVYRLDDRLFFANARYFTGRVNEAIRAAPYPVEWLVFDAEAMTHADVTGLEALDDLATDLRRRDIRLVIARLTERMREDLDESGVTDTIGGDHMYPTVRAAVDAYVRSGGALPETLPTSD